ncbi:hypothetical protein ACU4GA_15745 [Methylobacterium oryzae CBMB20]
MAAPASCTASLGAMQNFGGYIGGALAPTVTGFIVGGTGHFSMAFITGAVIALVAALGYWTLIQDPIADEAPVDPPVGALGAARYAEPTTSGPLNPAGSGRPGSGRGDACGP